MQWDAVEIIIPNEELELQMKEFIKHLHCGLIISSSNVKRWYSPPC